MAKLVVILAIIGLAYWYWSTSNQQTAEDLEAQQLKENAMIMQHCIKKQESMEASANLGGLVDIGSRGEDAERLCADQNSLYFRDGNWYSTEE